MTDQDLKTQIAHLNTQIALLQQTVQTLARTVAEDREREEKRIEKMEANMNRVVWLILAVVIGQVLAQAGLVGL